MYRVGLTRKLRYIAASRSAHFWLMLAPFIAASLYWHWRPLPSPFVSGQLVVMTRESPTTYYLDAEGKPAGFEYDLVSEFAKEHDWKLKLEVADDLDSLISETSKGRAHIAAAGLTVTSKRESHLLFGPPYWHERELVICGSSVKRPTTFAELAKFNLEVVKGSSHAERLMELRQAYPNLHWTEIEDHSSEDLLERVASGLSDCTVADASTFDVIRSSMPSLRVAMVLTKHRDIAWAMPLNADMRLRQAVSDFFRKIRANGQLATLRERYFGQVHHMAVADIQGLLARRISRLPDLKADFVEAQEKSGLDWRLLAALSYQESQWNPLATSPTGVRGIMMLTIDTANRLNVPDRLDVKASILAGARYLAMLKDELPDRIKEPDRTWMALAAYNIGMGHLEDARRLAQRLGKNPDNWHDLREVLPLLSKGRYRRYLRFGYARGGEARMLTENVKVYYDILKRLEPSDFTLDDEEAANN